MLVNMAIRPAIWVPDNGFKTLNKSYQWTITINLLVKEIIVKADFEWTYITVSRWLLMKMITVMAFNQYGKHCKSWCIIYWSQDENKRTAYHVYRLK